MTALIRTETDRLRAGFRGELIWPGDDGFDAARRVWNGMIDRRPAVIARAAETADVVAAVRFAAGSGLAVSIRGGGHSAAGLAVADGALMLDLSAMKAVHVDTAARTAVARPGLRWAELDAVTQAFGLATTGGVVGSTGIAGLTLGGGIGWLDRLIGLTCDNLLGAEIVTADGQTLSTCGDTRPELYWALRGGGGNFGVVTSFTYRLHPVTGAYGGLLGYPLDRAAEVLRAFHEVSAAAPDRLTLYAALLTAPPAPFVPEHMRGRRVVGVMSAYFGPADEAERALAPLRGLASRPVIDALRPMSYQQVQQYFDGLPTLPLHHYFTAEWLRGLDEASIEALVTAAAAAPSPHSMIVLKRMGGAVARVPAGDTAFWYRDAAYHLDVHAQWTPGTAPEPQIAWARAARQAARTVSAGGGYVNFLDPGEDRVRAAYGGNYGRLARIKAAYDPGNLFRHNNNIPPESGGRDGRVPPESGGRDGGRVPPGD